MQDEHWLRDVQFLHWGWQHVRWGGHYKQVYGATQDTQFSNRQDCPLATETSRIVDNKAATLEIIITLCES